MHKFIWLFLAIYLPLNADIISSLTQTQIQHLNNNYTISGGDIKDSTVVFSLESFNLYKGEQATFQDTNYIIVLRG